MSSYLKRFAKCFLITLVVVTIVLIANILILGISVVKWPLLFCGVIVAFGLALIISFVKHIRNSQPTDSNTIWFKIVHTPIKRNILIATVIIAVAGMDFGALVVFRGVYVVYEYNAAVSYLQAADKTAKKVKKTCGQLAIQIEENPRGSSASLVSQHHFCQKHISIANWTIAYVPMAIEQLRIAVSSKVGFFYRHRQFITHAINVVTGKSLD